MSTDKEALASMRRNDLAWHCASCCVDAGASPAVRPLLPAPTLIEFIKLADAKLNDYLQRLDQSGAEETKATGSRVNKLAEKISAIQLRPTSSAAALPRPIRNPSVKASRRSNSVPIRGMPPYREATSWPQQYILPPIEK